MAYQVNPSSSAIYNDVARPIQKTSVPADSLQITDTAVTQNTDERSVVGTDGQKSGSDDKKIKSAISDANNKMKQSRTRCEFSYDEESHRVSIKVMNEDTNEVIKEIPPKKTLEMLDKLLEISGLLLDERR